MATGIDESGHIENERVTPMIKLYHSPHSRSSGILSLLRMMGKDSEVEIETVHIRRQGGVGQNDPKNPHPEGKVPLLEVNGHFIRERGAIMLWLTDHFDSPLGRGADDPLRGEYLSWLFYYGSVVEPVLYLSYLDLADNALIYEWCRDQATMFAALERALEQHAFLIDDKISAADLLVSAPFQWFPDLIPAKGAVRDWFDACQAAQDAAFLETYDTQAMEQLGLPVTTDLQVDA